jgi:hypothetical protein
LHFDIRAAARRRLLGGSALLLMLLLLLVLLESLLLFLFWELLSLSLLPRTEKQTIGSRWTFPVWDFFFLKRSVDWQFRRQG